MRKNLPLHVRGRSEAMEAMLIPTLALSMAARGRTPTERVAFAALGAAAGAGLSELVRAMQAA